VYDKVFPYEDPEEGKDDIFYEAYNWLGSYCGFSPQIWLSRSRSEITGFKNGINLKKRKYILRTREDARTNKDKILFGFENVIGFPVDFNLWELILCCMEGNTVKEINVSIAKFMEEMYLDSISYKIKDKEVDCWINSNRDINIFLKKYVFVENDQVVVSSLNLKTAKQIICRDERQKKKLRQMGFIEDRIKVKNIKTVY